MPDRSFKSFQQNELSASSDWSCKPGLGLAWTGQAWPTALVCVLALYPIVFHVQGAATGVATRILIKIVVYSVDKDAAIKTEIKENLSIYYHDVFKHLGSRKTLTGDKVLHTSSELHICYNDKTLFCRILRYIAVIKYI